MALLPGMFVGGVAARQADWGWFVNITPSSLLNAGTIRERARNCATRVGYRLTGRQRMWYGSLHPDLDYRGERSASDRSSRRRRRHAAVDHDGLAGHEGRGVGAEIGHRAGDLVGLADPAQRRGGAAAFQALLVFPQRAGEIGLDAGPAPRN